MSARKRTRTSTDDAGVAAAPAAAAAAATTTTAAATTTTAAATTTTAAATTTTAAATTTTAAATTAAATTTTAAATTTTAAATTTTAAATTTTAAATTAVPRDALDAAAATAAAQPFSADETAAIAAGTNMPIDAAVLAAALARGIGELAARQLAQQIANERRPCIELRGVGASNFVPVGQAEIQRSPVCRPVHADDYGADDLNQAYYAACKIADAHDRSTGTKPAMKRFSAAYNKTKAVVAAALDAVMRDYGIAELPRDPVPNRASVPRIAVGTQMCRPNTSGDNSAAFGRVCRVDADGTLHLELYAVETLGRWNLTGMYTLYHRRVGALLENTSTKRARYALSDPSTDLGAAYAAREHSAGERLRPSFGGGTWSFGGRSGPDWALWNGAPGDEFHETYWWGR